jgi:oligopeptide/dipeptide ABC transporter ATP-binding protein
MVLKHKADKKEAIKVLKTINGLLALTDKTETDRLMKYVEETPKDTSIDLSEFETLFADTLEREIKKQADNINILLPTLKEIEAAGFEDLAKCEEAFKKIYKPLAACELGIAIEKDNDLSVFPTIVKDFCKSAKLAKKLIEQRDAYMAKYNVQDFYDLPADVRAKLREVITTPEAYSEKLKAATATLIAHLEKLTSKSEEEKMALSSLILERYANAVVASKSVLTANDAKHKAVKMLQEVGIKDAEKRYAQYPFELSGGMRQRIVIAIALCSSPEVLICDEPTTALDVTIQSQILELINKLKKERNLSIVFITHDLGVVANMADDIAVMYAGKIVEYGTSTDIFYDPRHPYTIALLGSMPDLETKEKLQAIPGTPPNMLLPPKGDAFADRNAHALAIDYLEQPPFFQVSDTHFAATWVLDELAPDFDISEVVKARIRRALSAHPEYTPKPTNTKNSVLKILDKKGVTAEIKVEAKVEAKAKIEAKKEEAPKEAAPKKAPAKKAPAKKAAPKKTATKKEAK